VAHTTDEKKALLARVNRIQGQLQSIREGIEKEKDCADVLQQIAACRGAVTSLLVEILEGEIRFHVLGKNVRVDSREAKAAENLVEILHRYIK
jgi:DNA-binding FrmR family transcriptional regulator